MGKKKKNEAVDAAVNHEEKRRLAIAEYNVNNMGKYWIDPNKVPTDEDIELAKKDFDDYQKKINERGDYFIADKANALRVAKFLRDFTKDAFWCQRSFVGILNLYAHMNEFIDAFDENNPVDLTLDYGPMTFTYMMLENYAGIGIESANHMAEIWDEYLPIYELLHKYIDDNAAEHVRLNDLQMRWGMMSQGYYMTIVKDDETTLEEINLNTNECSDESKCDECHDSCEIKCDECHDSCEIKCDECHDSCEIKCDECHDSCEIKCDNESND